MATQGQPSQFSFCVAENEASNPWQPLHVERGFRPSESAVTVVTAENPHNINDSGSTAAEEWLTTISGSLTAIGSNNFIGQGGNPILALSPEHAETIARDGWSKDDVKTYLFEHARVPLGRLTEFNRQPSPLRRATRGGRGPDCQGGEGPDRYRGRRSGQALLIPSQFGRDMGCQQADRIAVMMRIVS